ncbi:MAG: Anaphase-promoting complex subunit 1 [Sclerophora amabilis]|nr:MAG: Anaphase-promoting complex subunit 1 [Sclerophora amabilis]
MASVLSLGIHHPSAIPFLGTESILPPKFKEGQYSWVTYDNAKQSGNEDELFVTENCVVWSQGGIVKKVYRFEIEKENVAHAVITWFPTPQYTVKRDNPHPKNKGGSANIGPSGKKESPDRRGKACDGKGDSESSKARALVVFLRTQAHVYFLSGTSHVVHLPFEVESVHAAPRGLILQRRQPLPSSGSSGPVPPTAPPNSFISLHSQSWSAPTSQPIRSVPGAGPPQLPLPPPALRGTMFNPIFSVEEDRNLPRFFSLTDPLTEMGLVVANTAQDSGLLSTNRGLLDMSPGRLSPAEDMVYISSPLDIHTPSPNSSPADPVVLALTANYETHTYTVWTVSYPDLESAKRRAKLPRSTASGIQSRARTSFGPGTGATTPVGHGAGVRESFGGTRGQGSNAPPNLNASTGASQDEFQIGVGDELASSLDPDFEGHRAPDKQSRRVSSLLARSDLSTNRDRLAFSDLATGHGAASTSGVFGNSRRGESLGSYIPRGSSRASLGVNRKSMPANGSFLSSHDGTYSNVVVDELLEELNAGGDFDGFENMGLREATEGLRREVIMTKIESIPIETNSSENSIRHVKPRVFVITPPTTGMSLGLGVSQIVMCIADKQEQQLLTLTMNARQPRTSSVPAHLSRRRSGLRGVSRDSYDTVRLMEVKRGSNVLDAAKLVDGQQSRIVVLSKTSDGHGELTLQNPWSTLIKIQLPEKIVIFNPYEVNYSSIFNRRHEGGAKRVLRSRPKALVGLERESSNGRVDVVDSEGKRHRIQIRMQPRSKLVAKSLDVCAWVLPGTERGGEGVFTGWIEVQRWLQSRSEVPGDLEWTALIVVLMCMGVEFIPTPSVRESVKQKKRSSGFLRSSSGASVDTSKWNEMLDEEFLQKSSASDWMAGAAWNWIPEETINSHESEARKSPGTRRSVGASTKMSAKPLNKKSLLLVDCVSMAREFIRTPAGKAASGPQGYLPTAEGKNPELRRTALATILVGLHLSREELKLNIASSEASATGTARLTPVLAQLGGWMMWDDWSWREGGYYNLEDTGMEEWSFDQGSITKLELPKQPFSPPSIYDWIWDCAKQQHQQQPFMTLLKIVSPQGASLEMENAFGQQRQGHWTMLTPRTPIILNLFESLAKKQMSAEDIINVLIKVGIDTHFLETLPEGILTPLREALVTSQADPPTTWTKPSLDLVDRNDLSILLSTEKKRKDSPRSLLAPTHESLRDVHSICNSTFDTEALGSFDGSAEYDRQAVTRLIFREDRRFIEASKLLQSTKPSIARCEPEPDWSESDLLDAQKELVQTVAVRTLAIPSARGLLFFSARLPLLTERFPIAGFNLSCVMKPSNNTVSADRSSFTEEKVGWAFFHVGVAAGLSISRDAKGIDTSWIVYNKPTELSNRHAGFLLALGLNGHLKSIAKWVAFKYLTPKHTMTSIGLLLGLSASYLGTMDTLITRLLSVHVTRMLPPGAAELNLSPLTQTTGMMGIGLLYCNTQHRRMSEVMLSEIEFIDIEDTSTPVDALRDEGYRLAAGFALGYINLGKGKDLKGLHDMHIIERLLALAVGNKRVGIVHVLDKTTAAATIAITLIFMKSHDEVLARKIDIPDTMLQFDNVRPDIFLLRTLAKHLIMWNTIKPTSSWIEDNVPLDLKDKFSIKHIFELRTEHLPFYNIVAGLCFSIALRFAGSGSLEARNVLIRYLDEFMRICGLLAINYDQKLTRSTVRNCQDVLALSAATVMAGTGDLLVFRRLRSLHGRNTLETPYGSHLAAHIAIGALFLGGGNYTFGTSDLAIASLLCAFYPLTPKTILDNKSHLQAFRHFWVLATEARCIVARDVDTHRPVSIPLSITLRNGNEVMQNAPCLLPELRDVSGVATASSEHWRVVLDFANNSSHLDAFTRNQTIYVRRRAAHDVSSSSSVFQATLQALDDTEALQHPLEWLLNLPSFATLDKSERALVLPPDAGNPVQASTESTLVDTRLILEKACLNADKADRLRNLKLLFAWAERAEWEGKKMKWVTREVVDRLRAAVWMTFRDEES